MSSITDQLNKHFGVGNWVNVKSGATRREDMLRLDGDLVHVPYPGTLVTSENVYRAKVKDETLTENVSAQLDAKFGKGEWEQVTYDDDTRPGDDAWAFSDGVLFSVSGRLPCFNYYRAKSSTDGDTKCPDCGMSVQIGDWHPFAACLMYKGCGDKEVVEANLKSVMTHRTDVVCREQENSDVESEQAYLTMATGGIRLPENDELIKLADAKSQAKAACKDEGISFSVYKLIGTASAPAPIWEESE